MLHRLQRLIAIVHTTQGGQLRVIERLNTNRDAVHTGLGKPFKPLNLEGSGVGF